MSTRQEPVFSPGVREVLERIPSWYERWGTTVVALVVGGLLVLAGLIHYPDVLTAPVTVTTQTPPLTLYARTTGALTQLRPENAEVAAGTWLAVVAGTAAATQVQQVQQQLREVERHLTDPAALARLRPPRHEQLGELQADYVGFVDALYTYQYVLATPHFRQRVRNVNDQVAVLNELNAKLLRQQRLLEQEFRVVARQYRRDSALLANRVISPADFESSQARYLQQKSGLAGVAIGRQRNELQKADLAATLITGDEQQQSTRLAARTRLAEALARLQSRLAWWEQTYVLQAPVAGRLTYLQSWTPGQYVASRTGVFAVVPARGKLVVQATLPLRGAGKVRPGQRALIRLEDYPPEQFGMLAAEVTALAAVPGAGGYRLTLRLPQGLRTSTRQQLPFRQQMQGSAQIITQDYSLLERVFFRFRQLLTART